MGGRSHPGIYHALCGIISLRQVLTPHQFTVHGIPVSAVRPGMREFGSSFLCSYHSAGLQSVAPGKLCKSILCSLRIHQCQCIGCHGAKFICPDNLCFAHAGSLYRSCQRYRFFIEPYGSVTVRRITADRGQICIPAAARQAKHHDYCQNQTHPSFFHLFTLFHEFYGKYMSLLFLLLLFKDKPCSQTCQG